MATQGTLTCSLEDIKVSVKLKLATLWASFMFLYIYADYFHLYMPDVIHNIIQQRVYEFNITQGFLVTAFVSVSIPALMIFLSVALPAKISRRLNMTIATLYIPYSLFNLVGEAWLHMYFAATTEVVLLFLIIRYSWKWPRTEIIEGRDNV